MTTERPTASQCPLCSGVSFRDTEVKHGMLHYGLTDEAAYWHIKQPDAVSAPANWIVAVRHPEPPQGG